MEATPGRPLLPQHPDAERRLNSGDSRSKRLTLKSGLRVLTPSRPGHSMGAETAGRGAVLKGVTPESFWIAFPVFIFAASAISLLNAHQEDSKSPQ
jgi:hypothetical protein